MTVIEILLRNEFFLSNKFYFLILFLPEGLLSSLFRDARMVENRGLFSLLLLLLFLRRRVSIVCRSNTIGIIKYNDDWNFSYDRTLNDSSSSVVLSSVAFSHSGLWNGCNDKTELKATISRVESSLKSELQSWLLAGLNVFHRMLHSSIRIFFLFWNTQTHNQI